MALVLLAACSASGSSTGGGGPASITVTDQRGETVELDGPVERVVTIVMPAASLFAAVDGGVDHLVGMNPASKTALVDGVLGDFYPEAKEISDQVSGTDFVPNVEAVLELDPDVVVQWGDRGDRLTKPLEEAGIPVIGLRYGTQDDLEKWVEIFGTILGKQDRAGRIIGRFDRDARSVRSAVDEAADRPRVMSLTAAAGSYSTANSSSYAHHYIQLAGARNVAAALKNADEVGLEQILAWDPQIVLLGNFDTLSPRQLYRDPRWSDVTAVRERRVYQMPMGGYRWDPPSQESGLAWRWLAKIAHPELELGGLRADIAADYRFLYGKEPTAEQLDRILAVEDNSLSRDYAVFAR